MTITRYVGKVSGKAEEALERLARHYLALHHIVQEEELGALAVKCWPEFQEMRQMNICLANSLLVRFDQEAFHLIKTIIEEGIEHHYAMAYGDIKEALVKFCQWLDIRPILV